MQLHGAIEHVEVTARPGENQPALLSTQCRFRGKDSTHSLKIPILAQKEGNSPKKQDQAHLLSPVLRAITNARCPDRILDQRLARVSLSLFSLPCSLFPSASLYLEQDSKACASFEQCSAALLYRRCFEAWWSQRSRHSSRRPHLPLRLCCEYCQWHRLERSY